VSGAAFIRLKGEAGAILQIYIVGPGICVKNCCLHEAEKYGLAIKTKIYHSKS
jgi:hypothetical protein